MAGITASYVDSDSFTVLTDRTAEFSVGRRVKALCYPDGTKYGTVESASYSSPLTTVNLYSTNDDLTSNLTEVWFGRQGQGTGGSVPMHDHDGYEGSGGSLSPSVFYVDADETDQGAAGDGNTIKAFVDAIGSDSATIYLRHNSGSATTTYTLTTNETIPANITLEIENGAIIDGAGTLVINGSFDAGLYQVFGSSITIVSLKRAYPQWWGALSNGTNDDTAAIQSAIDTVFDSAKGVTIFFHPGKYIITSPLTADPSGSVEQRNISFIGLGGGGNTTRAGASLIYRGSNADGMFDLDAVQDFHFERFSFKNEGTEINQIFKLHASTASTLSLWGLTFEKCMFYNTLDTDNELANGHIYMYNALTISIRNCKFYGSPINITMGIDPDLTDGLAQGSAAFINITDTNFTGDVILYRAQSITFGAGTTFSEKTDNAKDPYDESTRVYVPDETYTLVSNINFIGVTFGGLPGSDQLGAIVLEDEVKGVVVYGCWFRRAYSRGIVLHKDVDAVDIRGNYADMYTAANSRLIAFASSFTGRCTASTNHLSAAMVAAGGELFNDNRAAPFAWPYVVDKLATGDYAVIAGDTWETALTSGNCEWREGFYRIRVGAIIQGGATRRVQIRVISSGSYVSRINAEATVKSGENVYLTIDDVAYIAEAADDLQSFSLQVREETDANASVIGLADSGIAGTYLQVLPF